jgi:hypothetical protein
VTVEELDRIGESAAALVVDRGAVAGEDLGERAQRGEDRHACGSAVMS